MKWTDSLALALAALALARSQQTHRKVSHMATSQDFQALADKLNKATNDLAAQVADLRAKVQAGIDAGGLDKAAEDEVLAQFQAVEAKLAALGADPANPVPA